MKAIIMAGGEGSRLRPLTCARPKPMTPLMDRPVLSYSMELLERHGVREAALALMYLPECVTSWLGDGARFDMNVRYYIEETPLGTAGSVRQARDFLDETFVVLSGDGVTDCDLTAAYQWHRRQGALATIVIKHVENPLEYGVVIADAAGRVTRFVEKPGWGEVCSDTVNTGIYILEPQLLDMIPENTPYDFSRDLFPRLLKREDGLRAWTMSGYWCDVGDIAAYLKAHADAMDGRINLNVNCRPGGVLRMPGARMEAGSAAFEESALGEGAVLGENASLMPGVKIWPKKSVGAGLKLDSNVVWGSASRPAFRDGALNIDNPAEAMRASEAAASVMKMRRVLLGRACSAPAQAGMLALQAGFMAQGVQVYDGGCAIRPQLRWQQTQLGLEAAAHFDGQTLRLYDERGAEIGASARRSIESALRRQDYARAFSLGARPPVNAGRSDLAYIGALRCALDREALKRDAPPVALYAPTEQLLSLAERAFEQAGLCVRAEWEEEMMELSPGEIGVWLSEDGESMTLADEKGCLSEGESQLFIVWAALEAGLEPALPSIWTHAAEELAARYGKSVARVSAERSAFMRALLDRDERLFRLAFDGIYAALNGVALLTRYALTPREWARALPALARSVRTIPMGLQERGRVLRALEDDDILHGGANGAWAAVVPAGDRPECRVVAEAADMEAADELCAFYEDRIRALMKSAGKK